MVIVIVIIVGGCPLKADTAPQHSILVIILFYKYIFRTPCSIFCTFTYLYFACFAHLGRMGRYDNPAKGRDCVGDVAEVMVEVAGSLVGIG